MTLRTCSFSQIHSQGAEGMGISSYGRVSPKLFLCAAAMWRHHRKLKFKMRSNFGFLMSQGDTMHRNYHMEKYITYTRNSFMPNFSISLNSKYYFWFHLPQSCLIFTLYRILCQCVERHGDHRQNLEFAHL